MNWGFCFSTITLLRNVAFPSGLQVCLIADLPSLLLPTSLGSQNIVLSSLYLLNCPQNEMSVYVCVWGRGVVTTP